MTTNPGALPRLDGVNSNPVCLLDPFYNPVNNRAPYSFYVWLILLVLGLVHMLACFLIFFHFKSKYRRVEIRSSLVTFLALACGICQMFSGVVPAVANIPCAFSAVGTLSVVPLGTFVAMLQLTDFFTKHGLADYIKEELKRLQDQDLPLSSSNVTKYVKILKFASKTRGRVTILSLLLLPILVVEIALWTQVPWLNHKCYYCQTSTSQARAAQFYGIFICFLCIGVAIMVRKRKDPFSIVRQVFFETICAAVGLLSYILIEFDTTEYILGISVFLATQSFVWFVCVYPVFIAIRYDSSISHRKVTNRVVNNGEDRVVSHAAGGSKTVNIGLSEFEGTISGTHAESLRDLLLRPKDDPELIKFEAHVQSEFAIENLQCFRDISSWELGFNDMTDSTRRARARRLFNMFISSGSIAPINIPGTLRSQLQFAIITISDTPLSRNTFSSVKKELFHMLLGTYTRYYARVLKPQEANRIDAV